jgi:hypothetical protein
MIVHLSFAQNLQFNQVIDVGNQIQTVPTGKVWKIESILYSSPIGSVSSSLTQNDQILIDGNLVTVRSARSGNGGYNGASYFVWEQKLPIWLKEGTTVQTSTNVYKISILEFSIIP